MRNHSERGNSNWLDVGAVVRLGAAAYTGAFLIAAVLLAAPGCGEAPPPPPGADEQNVEEIQTEMGAIEIGQPVDPSAVAPDGAPDGAAPDNGAAGDASNDASGETSSDGAGDAAPAAEEGSPAPPTAEQ